MQPGQVIAFSLWLSIMPAPSSAQVGLDAGVVKIYSSVDGKRTTGSGFVVAGASEQVLVLTVSHVVGQISKTGVVFWGSRLEAPHAVTVLGNEYWDERGLALLSVKVPPALREGIVTLPLAQPGNVRRGDDVTLLGHPYTHGDWSLLRGYVTGREGGIWKVQAPAERGSSGGPVMKDGRVVGVVVAEQNGVALVKSIVQVRDYLAGLGVNPDGASVMAEESPAMPVPTPAPERKAGDIVLDRLSDGTRGPEMMVVDAGRFQMGSPSGEKGHDADEGPVHTVRIARRFLLGRHEVTRAEFGKFVQAMSYETEAEKGNNCWAWSDTDAQWAERSGTSWRAPGFEQTASHPVVCVSWNDAQAYVRWLSEETGEDYRLASESEWEYAARADTTESRYWGDDSAQACVYANVGDKSGKRVHPEWNWTIHDCDDGAVETSPVGRYEANGFGLHDMLGNVWEWVQDCYVDGYDGAPSDGSAREDGDCAQRVLRGGSWDDAPRYVRSENRFGNTAGYRSTYVGIRLARTL